MSRSSSKLPCFILNFTSSKAYSIGCKLGHDFFGTPDSKWLVNNNITWMSVDIKMFIHSIISLSLSMITFIYSYHNIKLDLELVL